MVYGNEALQLAMSIVFSLRDLLPSLILIHLSTDERGVLLEMNHVLLREMSSAVVQEHLSEIVDRRSLRIARE